VRELYIDFYLLLIYSSYLTAVDKSYYDSLSSASQRSLEFQGGPFKGQELASFEEDPFKEQMVMLRKWDDAAKVPGIQSTTPRAQQYRVMIEKVLLK
jgi:2-amino-1-hydroxyethylphosphonate dioxygenase (glycine-forming)